MERTLDKMTHTPKQNDTVMTEIEDLIRQAQETLKKWRKPNPDDVKRPRARSWREVLENRQAPKGSSYHR